MTAENAGRGLTRPTQLLTRRVNNEYVILDQRTGQAHALSGDAAAVWNAIETTAPHGLSDDRYDAVIAELVELGLLEPLDGISRRALIRVGAVAAATTGIVSIVLPEVAVAGGSSPIEVTTYESTLNVPAGATFAYTIVAGGGAGGTAATGGSPGGKGGDGDVVSGAITNSVANGPQTLTIFVATGGAAIPAGQQSFIGGSGGSGLPEGGDGGSSAGIGGAGGGAGGDGGGAGGATAIVTSAGTSLVTAGGGGGAGGGGTAAPGGDGSAGYTGTAAGGDGQGAMSDGGNGSGGGGGGGTEFGAGGAAGLNYAGGGGGGGGVSGAEPTAGWTISAYPHGTGPIVPASGVGNAGAGGATGADAQGGVAYFAGGGVTSST